MYAQRKELFAILDTNTRKISPAKPTSRKISLAKPAPRKIYTAKPASRKSFSAKPALRKTSSIKPEHAKVFIFYRQTLLFFYIIKTKIKILKKYLNYCNKLKFKNKVIKIPTKIIWIKCCLKKWVNQIWLSLEKKRERKMLTDDHLSSLLCKAFALPSLSLLLLSSPEKQAAFFYSKAQSEAWLFDHDIFVKAAIENSERQKKFTFIFNALKIIKIAK